MSSLAPVAQNQDKKEEPPALTQEILIKELEKHGVTLKNWNNPQYYKDKVQLLLLFIITLTDSTSPTKIHEFLQKIKLTGILSPNTIAAYHYILAQGAATVPTIAEKLGLPESSTYHSIKQLRGLDLIHQVYKIQGNPQGGPRLAIYSTEQEAEPQQILAVRKQERKRSTPGYEYCRETAQLLMDEYLDPVEKEITLPSITRLISRIGLPGNVSKHQASTQIAGILQQNGWKVWR